MTQPEGRIELTHTDGQIIGEWTDSISADRLVQAMYDSGKRLSQLVVRSTVENVASEDEPPLFLGTSIDNYIVIDPGSRAVTTESGTPIDTTVMGFDILASLARHPNKVRSHADMLRDSGSRSASSIKVPIKRLRSDLTPKYEQCIESRRAIGYVGILGFDPEEISKTKK